MEKLIDKIDRPSMLKNFSVEALKRVCSEIRGRIIEVLSESGGHLAPNLGVTELTVALHYVFDTPVDKIIWDVGHQCYPHKILTGRRDRFHTIRKLGGLSGFPKRFESEYDTFGTAHAGTAISAALGMAVARDQKKENHHVIAVVGDAGISTGLSFEGLNNAGELGTDLIVILNDNRMSISPNVGALSRHLSRIISSPLYIRVRNEVENRVKKLPAVGENMHGMLKKIEESLKNFIVPGLLFEELGFHYYGPIDGHNLEDLIEILKRVRAVKGPVLVHCLTKKGKGYSPAENDPETFHGCGAFSISEGSVSKSPGKLSYTQIFSHWVEETAANNSRVVALTAAMRKGTGLSRYAEKFPDRFFDVGINEEHAVTFAGGLACEGIIPIVAIYSTFLQRAFDEILHDVVLQKLPVVFAIDRAGYVGADGSSHHGLYDMSYLGCMPGMVIANPKDEVELQHLLHTAVQSGLPFAVRYPRDNSPGKTLLPFKEFQGIPVGSWEILREGSSLCIIATGSMVETSRPVAENLDATLVNGRFVKPIDREMLAELAGNHRFLVTVEEHCLSGGFGERVRSELAELCAEPPPLKTISAPDRFVEQGSVAELREIVGLSSDRIERNVKKFLEKTLR